MDNRPSSDPDKERFPSLSRCPSNLSYNIDRLTDFIRSHCLDGEHISVIIGSLVVLIAEKLCFKNCSDSEVDEVFECIKFYLEDFRKRDPNSSACCETGGD